MNIRKADFLLLSSVLLISSCGTIGSSLPVSTNSTSSDEPYVPIVEQEFVYSNLDLTNHTSFNSGSYSVDGNAGTCNDLSGHNTVFSTDVNVLPGQDFSYKAKVNVRNGTLHLAFGLKDDQGLQGWFGLLVESIGVIRFASEGCGTIGAGSNIHAYSFYDSDKVNGYLDLEIRVYANGEFEAFLNNQLIIRVFDSSFDGGRFGFANWECEADFKDLQYAVRDSIRTSFEIKDLSCYDPLRFRSGYSWNNWKINNDTIEAANRNRGDEFCMSTIKQEPNQNLIFKAHVNNSGRAAAIVFGATDISHPTEEGWYGFTFDRSERNVRGFAVNKGTIGAAMNNPTCTPVTNLDLTYGVDLKIMALSSGHLFYYLNDELITTLYDPTFDGGYIGFNTCDANATFSDMEIQLSNESPNSGISDIKLSNIDFTFDKANKSYKSIVTNIEETKLNIVADKNHEIYVNDELRTAMKISIEERDNYIYIMSKDIRNSDSSFTVINVKKIFDGDIKPLIHFTTEENWINDPNGLVYDEETETYHAFFQYSPDKLLGSITGWCHATSKDLCHWENKGVPIKSNEKGLAWSGGGFIDYENTSGLFDDSVPKGSRMCVAVTYHSNNPKIGLCYSLNHGETWLEAPDFVIDNENNIYGDSFRDPKVIWYENESLPNGGTWLMIVGGWQPCRIFSSQNLLDWQFESTCLDINANQINSECPDIFKMAVNGNSDSFKYVLSAGGTSYYVGNFFLDHGVIRFRSDQIGKEMFTCPTLWSNVGEFYATQGFTNDKYGRNILMSWMIDRTCPTISGKEYNGVASIPLEANLIQQNDEYIMTLYPVEEIERYAHDELAHSKINTTLQQGEELYLPLKNNNYDADMILDVSHSRRFRISLAFDKNKLDCPFIEYNIDNNRLVYCSSKSDPACSYILYDKIMPINGKINLRLILDSITFDLFVNDGIANMHGFFFARNGETNMKIESNDGTLVIDQMNISYIK